MIQSEFIRQYCKNSNITEEELNNFGLFSIPCACGEDNCKGWAMITKINLANHIQLYIKNEINNKHNDIPI